MELKNMFARTLFLSVFFLVSADAYGDLVDMTSQVFGTQTTRNILPMAFLGKNFTVFSLAAVVNDSQCQML